MLYEVITDDDAAVHEVRAVLERSHDDRVVRPVELERRGGGALHRGSVDA